MTPADGAVRGNSAGAPLSVVTPPRENPKGRRKILGSRGTALRWMSRCEAHLSAGLRQAGHLGGVAPATRGQEEVGRGLQDRAR